MIDLTIGIMLTASTYFAEIPQEEPLIDPTQLREMIRETLETGPIQLNTKTAVELLVLTAATESNLGKYFRQINGPALGIFQMEPATEKDIWNNYLAYKPELRAWVVSLKSEAGNNLKTNLQYQIAMARIHYYRVREALPPSDPELLAHYYKRFYNTHLGKGTIEGAKEKYLLYAFDKGE